MKRIIIVGLIKPKVIRVDSSNLIAGIGSPQWQNLFGHADLDIESRVINADRAIPECQKLNSELHKKMPDAVLAFETIPGITQIYFERVINSYHYGRPVSADNRIHSCQCSVNAKQTIDALKKHQIPADFSPNGNPTSESYILFSIALCVRDLPIRFGLIQLPLLSEEVCQNVYYRHNPSISRQNLIDAAKIICELA